MKDRSVIQPYIKKLLHINSFQIAKENDRDNQGFDGTFSFFLIYCPSRETLGSTANFTVITSVHTVFFSSFTFFYHSTI